MRFVVRSLFGGMQQARHRFIPGAVTEPTGVTGQCATVDPMRGSIQICCRDLPRYRGKPVCAAPCRFLRNAHHPAAFGARLCSVISYCDRKKIGLSLLQTSQNEVSVHAQYEPAAHMRLWRSEPDVPHF
ncbi:hypothetical protein, partial [Burkholderia sp.]|uniref:hypothetical protein n=1 Tax=Burkholderia sp. TaxID=36773 RepID=UPI0025B8A24A